MTRDWLRSSTGLDEGVNFTAGLPIVRTSPAHGTAYDIAGKGIASEDSFRQAVYVAMDVFRNPCLGKKKSVPVRCASSIMRNEMTVIN